MIDFKFSKAKWFEDSDGVWLSLQVPASLKIAVQTFVSSLSDKVFGCLIKQHREKRSLDSNAYAWLLINEIANVLRSSKDEVYLSMLKRYGQSFIVSVIEKAADVAEQTFPYCERFGEGTVDGKKFVHFKVFRGSSTYDGREMAILIDGIISEAEGLGINTMTPDEVERLKGAWKI